MWILLLLFGIHCLFPGIYLIMIAIIAKCWPILLCLLVVFIFAATHSNENSTAYHSRDKNQPPRNNRIRMEGKIGTTNVPTSTEDNPNGVTQDYATHYVIFKGKK